jgi:putative transposase
LPRSYDAEFRRRVLDLVRTGRPVRVVAAELGLAEATVYRWKAQDLVDRGMKPGTPTGEQGELAAARRRIRELELVKKAAVLFEEGCAQKPRTRSSLNWPGRASPPTVLPDSRRGRVRVLHVATPCTLATADPARVAVRPGATIHADSRGTYGWRRVNAELIYGHGVIVNRKTVRKIMRVHGLHGLPGPRKGFRSRANMATAADLVERRFDRPAPDQLWVTDITEHPTREGKVYCCVVLDVFSPPGGGLVDRQPPGHAAGHQRPRHGYQQPQPDPGPDRDPQRSRIAGYTSWAFTQRAKDSGLLPSMGTVGDAFDNAVIESFWGRMQTELLDRQRWNTRIELANAIFEYLEIFYNRRRRHSALGWLTPIEYEKLHTTNAA